MPRTDTVMKEYEMESDEHNDKNILRMYYCSDVQKDASRIYCSDVQKMLLESHGGKDGCFGLVRQKILMVLGMSFGLVGSLVRKSKENSNQNP